MGKRVSQEDIIMALIEVSFFKPTGATSLTDIADHLNIKKASLYNHFKSREELDEGAYKFCANYLAAINFLPPDLDSVTKRYSAATVLRGISNRYFKMHEKTPLFQIYSFLESQKYFSKSAWEIIKSEKKRLEDQTEVLLDNLSSHGKISLPRAYKKSCIQWFCAGLDEFLSNKMMEHKRLVLENPASGEGELFTLPNDTNLDELNRLIDDFTRRIG